MKCNNPRPKYFYKTTLGMRINERINMLFENPTYNKRFILKETNRLNYNYLLRSLMTVLK